MGLRPINPGLRTIFHNAIDASKVSLSVPAGETLVVSEELAGQLLASAAQFQDVTDGLTDTEREADKNAAEAREAIAAGEPTPAEVDAAAKPKRSRKS